MVRKIFLSITLLLIVNFSALCQCTGDPTNPGTPLDPDDSPCQVPLDTWVMVLMIAGLVYGVYNLYRKQKLMPVKA